ncbi:MAG: nuclease A inhibitor family protein [Cyanobacteria bacterium P01_H01_bin.152]
MASLLSRVQLQQHIQGLWFPSETEAPWTVPTWQLSRADAAEIRNVLRREAQTPVTEVALADLTAQVQYRCRGYGAEGVSIAQQHQALFDWLQQTCDRVQVFRVGTVTIDIVVIGITDNHYVALQTQSVET